MAEYGKAKRRTSSEQQISTEHTGSSHDPTYRNYSAAVSVVDVDAKLSSFGDSLSIKLQASMEHALSEFNVKLKESLVTSISQSISKNNEKVCYFTVDAIKACMPSITYGTKNVTAISESFKRHNLGQIDQSVLSSYCTKLNNAK
jgi:hypothetical protein